MEHVLKIAKFILDSFIHIWPYLLITIPIAVFVRLSDMSTHINKALGRNPVVSIFLATALGAFSPFCSCGVIPVIASLLISGVPLAPVMSFWIASPSMDPEIFFLSTAAIGWKLSVWRLMATFIISLLAGFITHISIVKGWLGENILRKDLSATAIPQMNFNLKKAFAWIKPPSGWKVKHESVEARLIKNGHPGNQTVINCCLPAGEITLNPEIKNSDKTNTACNSGACRSSAVSLKKRIADETLKAIFMVAKFMTLAFLINALIQFYVPRDSVYNLLGNRGPASVIIASLVGIPFYTSNITALPLISGLLEMGINEGAALAFLISGPMTTLPAMAAVRGLVRGKIFLLYISFALIGSVLSGLLLNIFG